MTAELETPDDLLLGSWWRRPTELWFHGIVAIAALVALLALSSPIPDVATLVFAAVFLVSAALVWFVRFIAYAFADAAGRAEGSAMWFGVAPLGALVFALLAWAHVPLLVRFELSKPWFDRAVHHDGDPSRIGLFAVHSRRPSGRGVLFQTDDGFLSGRGGIAYLPRGDADAPTGVSVARRIEGDWYVWEDEYAD